MSFKQPNTVSSIKKMLEDLRKCGYTGTLKFDYNGSGDSGDIEPPHLEPDMQGSLDALGWRMEYATGGYGYDQATGSYIHSSDNHDVCVLTLVSEILPGGWEINEGSYGEVEMNIDTGEITVKTNQNIMTTEYSEETY